MYSITQQTTSSSILSTNIYDHLIFANDGIKAIAYLDAFEVFTKPWASNLATINNKQ